MTSLMQEAEKARQFSKFKKAQKIYQTILRRSPSDSEEKIEAYLGLGDVERIQGLFSEALAHYQKAAQLYKNHHGEICWDAQVGWALAARASGRPEEALSVLQKALAAYKKEKDLQGQAFAHWALGGTFRIAGNMKKGLQELLTALKMFKTQRDKDGIAYTCCALGGIYRMLGRYSDSGKYYREANRRMRQNRDTFGIAYSYCGLGNVERMGGRFRQALPFYRKAEKLYGTIGDKVSYAYTLWSIGTTYKMLGDYKKAASDFFNADKLFKQTGDSRGRIYIHQGLAEIRQLISDPKSKLKKTLKKYDSNKTNQVEASSFKWENLHERFLCNAVFIQIKVAAELLENKKIKTPVPPRLRALIRNKAAEIASKEVKALYKKTGSKFYPKSLPVNWP